MQTSQYMSRRVTSFWPHRQLSVAPRPAAWGRRRAAGRQRQASAGDSDRRRACLPRLVAVSQANTHGTPAIVFALVTDRETVCKRNTRIKLLNRSHKT